jgi:hypothetical protein
VGRAVNGLISALAADPAKNAHGDAYAVRVFDGMFLAAGSPYYFQIHFTHNAQENEITIWQIQIRLSSGPH